MPDISKGQLGVIAIPLAVIVILLPVALYLGLSDDDGRETTDRSDAADTAPRSVTPPSAEVVVSAVDRRWDQEEIVVRRGQSLGVLNADNSAHNVTIDGETVADSLDPGQSTEWRAESAGTFELICQIHPNFMKAEIRVVEP